VTSAKHYYVLLIDAGNSAVKFQCHRLPTPTGATDKWPAEYPISEALTTAVTRIENADVSAERLLLEWRAAFQSLNASRLPSLSKVSCNSASDGLISWHLCWLSVGPVSIQKSIRDAFEQLSGQHAPPAIVPPPDIRLRGAGVQHLKNCYVRPSQLGADRWVAAVGWMSAYSKGTHGIQMIVSAGTATTIDLVRVSAVDDGSAEFLGGWILPGVRLMNESLRAGTRDLDFVVDQAIRMADIPNQSQAAITRGIGLAQAGFVGQLINQYQIDTIWVHGGFGPWWRVAAESFDRCDSVKQRIVAAPQIAFAGLMAIAMQNPSAPLCD
jgi:pantothenate kinase type III